ncbi:MAG TPA: ribbon-helix-helix domain-containing protein [Steroidobacteraceae bacterium]|nr:ribbon-helix-helix domain-containing protein [Steroidobacteraceae bacterium]
MKRSRSHGMEQIKVTVSSEVMAALDEYARSQGLSRADAVRAALCSAPQVRSALSRTPVSSRDVVGP